ncbi:MAG: peptidoglycan-binding protein [Verrucomicrobiota bacterium]|nr:peptidoglycan-binding protein [Verrucomicrobiota bacterium]
MKKRYLLLVCAIVCSVASAAVNENIRSAQAKLKESGFYFGEVNGATGTDFSAALTRYQIRNGLQITGTLNAETSKALGVHAEAAAPAKDKAAAAPPSDTWRRLRKEDARVPAAREAAAPRTAQPDTSGGPPAVLEPIGDGQVKLKKERLRDYVAAFVLAGLDPQVGAELEFFSDRVRYYNEGEIGREKIRADLASYDRHWPQRRFWLAGDLDVGMQPDSRVRVSFPLRYDLANGAKHKSGRVRKTLLLEIRGEDLEIVAVDETKA